MAGRWAEVVLLACAMAACRHAPVAAQAPAEPPATLFSYFTHNGGDGVHRAVRTRDFERWEPDSDSLRTPRGIRHGSAFLAPTSVLKGLLALDSLPPRQPHRGAGFLVSLGAGR